MELTPDNFAAEIAKAGPTLVRFHARSGCGGCTAFAPKWEAFAAAHPEIRCLSYGRDGLKNPPLDDIENRHGVQRFPTVVSFDGGKEIARDLGDKLPPERMSAMTETMQNVPAERLVTDKLDIELAMAQKRKEMFSLQMNLDAIVREMERRVAAPTEAPVVAPIAVSTEGQTGGVTAAVVNGVPLTHLNPAVMPPEAPEDACESCSG